MPSGRLLPGIHALGDGVVVSHQGHRGPVVFSDSCSTRLVLSALATFAFLLVSAPLPRKVWAFVVNLVRVVGLLAVASYAGPKTMLFAHTAIGPDVTLVAGLLALMRVAAGPPGRGDPHPGGGEDSASPLPERSGRGRVATASSHLPPTVPLGSRPGTQEWGPPRRGSTR